MAGSGSSAAAAQSRRPPRADALRNREAVIAATRAALARADGVFSLESIARDAGVGIGTLYRHFPTREALIDAVYAAELDALARRPSELLETLPDAALREWAHGYAAFIATKRGIAETLKSGSTDRSFPTSKTRERIRTAVQQLLDAGVEAGTLRADITSDDVATLLLGVFLATAANHDPAQANRLIGVTVDALRSGAAAG